MWDDLTKTLKNGKSYHVKNLSIKSYSGNTLLGTTPTTLFREGVMSLFPLTKSRTRTSGQCRETISVSEFKFVDQLNIYIICQIKTCNTKNATGKNIVQCSHLEINNATKNITARLCADSGIFKQEELN